MARQGRAGEAVLWLNHAVELQPTFIDARLHLAAVLHWTGQAAKAVSHVRYVLKLDPENKAALSLMERIEGGSETSSKP